MKAILVIDMPTDCNECPCFYEEAYRCQLHTEIDEDLYHGKPSWCPLRPMPTRKEVHYADPFFGEVENLTNIGYNRCLVDLGDTE